MKPTTEAMLEAYGEKLAAQIGEMSDEEVQLELQKLAAEEEAEKEAGDEIALGRFEFRGCKAGLEDFADLLEKHAGDQDAALEEYIDDLEKNAQEVAAAEELAEKLASEESGESDPTPEDVAIAAAFEADPEGMKTAALKVLKDRGIGIYSLDANGNPIEELQLS